MNCTKKCDYITTVFFLLKTWNGVYKKAPRRKAITCLRVKLPKQTAVLTKKVGGANDWKIAKYKLYAIGWINKNITRKIAKIQVFTDIPIWRWTPCPLSTEHHHTLQYAKGAWWSALYSDFGFLDIWQFANTPNRKVQYKKPAKTHNNQHHPQVLSKRIRWYDAAVLRKLHVA